MNQSHTNVLMKCQGFVNAQKKATLGTLQKSQLSSFLFLNRVRLGQAGKHLLFIASVVASISEVWQGKHVRKWVCLKLKYTGYTVYPCIPIKRPFDGENGDNPLEQGGYPIFETQVTKLNSPIRLVTISTGLVSLRRQPKHP